jgi:hypothetical protein
MRLSGFTFVRNAVRFDYPVVESISSILPVVDEFVVNVGPDEDGTLDLIRSIDSPKIKVVRSQWNPNLKVGGYIYSQQTNIALFNCTGDWAVYLQADEVVHEDDLPIITDYCRRYVDDDRVEGLALHELTFWGDYRTIMNVYPWRYSRRCWVVKPHKYVMSRGDAAGFCVLPKYKEHGRYIRVVDTPARVFHYAFVKSRKALTEKYREVWQYWSELHTEETIERFEHDFYATFPRQFMDAYTGSHPGVMQQRIAAHPMKIDLDSPAWKTALTRDDRRRLIKTRLVRALDDRFLGRGSYTLIKG